MSDLSITTTAVLKSSGGQQTTGLAGETIAQGDFLYQKTDDNKWYKADGNDSTKQPCTAIALCGASAGQPVFVCTEDPDLAIGTHGITVGTPYYLSNTPGKSCPVGDIGTGNITTLLFIAKTATTVAFKPVTAGVAQP
jgi:hypothetical protein